MSQSIIITGMHRSGTSLTASILQSAGVNIGSQLIGPDKGNLFGHFEDVAFNNFHNKVLSRFHQDYLVQDLNTLGPLTPEETADAKSLIEQRRQFELWGWKDPRTSLFLDFWNTLLPQARYVFLYRHPLEVVISILRRGKHFDENALADPLTALYSWQTHNQAILDFYQQHQERCVLAHITTVTADIDHFIKFTAKKLDISLTNTDVSSIYHASELMQDNFSEQTMLVVNYVAPGIISILDQLNTCADLPYTGPQAIVREEKIVHLEQLINDLDRHNMLKQEQRSYLFSLLLTYVAPSSIVASKEILRQIRTEQIQQLTTQITQLQNERLSLHQQNVEKSRRIQELQNLSVSLESIQHQLVQQTDLLNELKGQLTAKDELAQHLQQQIANQKSHNAQLQQRLNNQHQYANDLTERLTVMENTRVWRLARRWYGIKEKIVGKEESQAARVSVPSSKPTLQQPTKRLVANNSPRSNIDRPAVLFISHYAGRTGAPMLLLNFLKWFKVNTEIPFEILLKEGGELLPEFEALGHTMVWGQRDRSQNHMANIDLIKNRLENSNIGLIFANTITNGDLIADLSSLNCPIVCYVHELEYWITYKTPPKTIKQVIQHTTHYVAGSNAVKQNLIKNLKVHDDRVDIVHSFICTTEIQVDLSNIRIRKELGIPPDAFVVVACGTTDWRKGPDLFIQLAHIIYRHQPEKPVHFVWVGGEDEGPVIGSLLYDVKRIGLEDYIHFVSTRPNFRDFMAASDVFTLVSREDPFPLVVLEAALLNKPIICFDHAGGAGEFVEQDSGFVIPYLDLEAMADRVLQLLHSPELKQSLGQRAAQKVRERHDVAVGSFQMFNIVERILNKEKVYSS
ncbi:MAG: glycosyltransferase [Anaerolineae bacterium]|nr:glycosyltransferase [Anaerolineae bacterium]